MTTLNNNIPALRFPEFKEEWTNFKLEQISINVAYGMNSAAIPFDGKHKYLRITDIDAESREFLSSSLTSPDGAIEEKYRLKESDIVFARTGASVGKCYLYKKHDGELYFAGFLIRFTIINAIPYFVFSQTFRNQYNNWVQRMSMRSGQPGINAEEFKTLNLSCPDINEQNKIATFFTTIDEKLQALKKKKTLLEQYKKGAMQKIFSQEIRFKDENGEEFEEWEEKKLGEVAIKKSSNISANKIEDNFGDYIIYGASGILKKVDFYKEENDYVSIIKDGAGVGRIFYCEGKTSVLGTMEIIKPIAGINTYFLYCLLNNIDFVKYITGSTIPHIYFKNYSNEICGIPCLAEQTKIANFLSSIDEKIEKCQLQILQTEQYKKGLLQKMFC